MRAKLSEEAKFDIGLTPQTLNNSNATGAWYQMRDFRRALAVLHAGAAAATKTSKIEFVQAKDASGTDAKAFSPAVETTVTANSEVVELTITLATVLATEAVTVNGVTFTAHASATTAANREFSISGNDAADATELANLINNADYGVAGVIASVVSNAITLKAKRPGEKLVSASSAASTFTIATTKHQASVECSHFDLDSGNGFEWVAARVTTTGNTPLSVMFARYEPRESVKS
jgi:hypothetical protein